LVGKKRKTQRPASDGQAKRSENDSVRRTVRSQKRKDGAIPDNDDDSSVQGVLVRGMLLPQRPASLGERQRPSARLVG
jgi:hypothetical protein